MDKTEGRVRDALKTRMSRTRTMKPTMPPPVPYCQVVPWAVTVSSARGAAMARAARLNWRRRARAFWNMSTVVCIGEMVMVRVSRVVCRDLRDGVRGKKSVGSAVLDKGTQITRSVPAGACLSLRASRASESDVTTLDKSIPCATTALIIGQALCSPCLQLARIDDRCHSPCLIMAKRSG
jgi:hypothetical protein